MDIVITLLLCAASFIGGVLFGRANPDKAKIIKDYLDDVTTKAGNPMRG